MLPRLSIQATGSRRGRRPEIGVAFVLPSLLAAFMILTTECSVFTWYTRTGPCGWHTAVTHIEARLLAHEQEPC
jgi:hypothetical protein